MGYMGLSSWVESDNAADARGYLQAILKKKNNTKMLRKFFKDELNSVDNNYNTDGPINLSLIMEDEGNKHDYGDGPDITPMVSELLTKREFAYLVECMDLYVKLAGKSETDEDEWTKENRSFHHRNYSRMAKFVTKKFNERFNNETSNRRKSKLQRLRPRRKVS